MSKTPVAAIQMVSTHDKDENLRQAEQLLQQAAGQGAVIAVLPENFAVLDTANMPVHGRQEIVPEGPIRQFLAEQARKLSMWIVGGSLPVAARPDGEALTERVRASCIVIDDQGREVARYDKIHLFDAQVEDSQGQYRESDTFEPGDRLVTVETPAGRLGLAICYDLRFPELFRQLREQQVDWITLPSAFTWQTGDAHWQPLLRARAIENQVWMVAPGQGGQNSFRRRTYGHTMIVDPWGRVLDELPEGPGVIMAQLDSAWQQQVRQRMPV